MRRCHIARPCLLLPFFCSYNRGHAEQLHRKPACTLVVGKAALSGSSEAKLTRKTLRQPPAGRDIELQVLGTAGEGATVMIDSLATGDALLLRARCCLGEGLDDLVLPNGEPLSMVRSLKSQGLMSGEVVVAKRTGKLHQPVVRQRRQLEITQFSFFQHTSDVSEHDHRFELIINARHEPDAIAEATQETVKADITEDHIKVTIRGSAAEYALYRRISSVRLSPHAGLLPVGFSPLCPARCSLTVVPHKKIQIRLHPNPVLWIAAGTRVQIQGLKQAAKLNGSTGTVTGYFENRGNVESERYTVKIDGTNALKRIKRVHLQPLESKHHDDVDAAAGGMNTDLGKDMTLEKTFGARSRGIPCGENGKEGMVGIAEPSASVLEWSSARRRSGLEAQRLQLLDKLP